MKNAILVWFKKICEVSIANVKIVGSNIDDLPFDLVSEVKGEK